MARRDVPPLISLSEFAEMAAEQRFDHSTHLISGKRARRMKRGRAGGNDLLRIACRQCRKWQARNDAIDMVEAMIFQDREDIGRRALNDAEPIIIAQRRSEMLDKVFARFYRDQRRSGR